MWRQGGAILKGLGALGSYFNRPGMGDGYGGAPGELSEPYRQSAYVMRAIKKVAGPIAAVSLQFSLDGRGGKQLFTEPGLEQFWKAPARGLSYADLIELSVVWLKLEGEFFWLLDDSWLPEVMSRMPFPEVGRSAKSYSPLIVARPDRMKEIVEDGKLTGWEFTDGARRKHILNREQVVHCKCPNPYNEFRGLAEWLAAKVAAETDYLAGIYSRNLMRNNGDRGPIIIGKDGVPEDAQMKQITEALRDKRELGLRGIFKPLFLAGNITVEDPKAQVVDAAFVAARIGTQEEIFLAFGVPPSMAHKMESYSIGSASDWYVLINETCIPTGAKVMDCIEVVASRQSFRTGTTELSAWCNWGQHPVMQQVRKESVDSLVKLATLGMPVREGNEWLQLGLPEYKGWEVGYLPFSVAPVGSPELSPETDPGRGETDLPQRTQRDAKEEDEEEEGPIGEMRRALKAKVLSNQFSVEKSIQEFQKSRTGREVAQWREQMAKRRPVEKGFQSRFNKELFKARAEVLQKLAGRKIFTEGREGREGMVTKAAAADFMFSLERFADGIIGAFRKQAEIGLQLAGQDVFAEIGREDDPWRVPPREVTEFVAGRENRLKGASQEVWDQVKGELQAGLDAGDTTEQLADRVRGKMNGISREHAEMIAKTETAAAYGVGRELAMKSAGVQFKKWLTSGNANVRAAHAAANGQVVGIEETFEVGGEELAHPGDPSGSPGNVINCHCVSVAVAGGEA